MFIQLVRSATHEYRSVALSNQKRRLTRTGRCGKSFNRRTVLATACVATAIASLVLTSYGWADDLEPVRYQNPGLNVDLGVGLYAWPLPMDFDDDGDLDMVISCSDKPYNGTYVFENPGGAQAHPIFRAARRIGPGMNNVQISWVDDQPQLLTPGVEYQNFRSSVFSQPKRIPVEATFHQPVGPYSEKVRANQWKYVDYDADGDHDLLVGVGDWSDYGWDDAYNDHGEWTHGPLHGFVYVLMNLGDDASPQYSAAQQLTADGRPIDVYGWPSPNLDDFDGDGDLDLVCGEFLDGFTYFQNVGTRQVPRFAVGKPLTNAGHRLRMDLQMILPIALDWDGDGDIDLVVGDEDGRVALVEHTGKVDNGIPVFLPPTYFQQEADWLKCGALATPFGIDWDGDGDDDILSGNTAGYIVWFENLGASTESDLPRWAAPQRLTADGQTIRIQAGANGSIQGPCEAKWGYTTLTAGDWDQDGLPDVMINSIWGRIQWFRNVGTRTQPQLAAAQDVQVDWPGTPTKPTWTWWQPKDNQLVTQWRTTPVMVDWNADGLNDLVMLDHEGFLTLLERERDGQELRVQPPRRIFFTADGEPLRLNDRRAGKSGRRKLAVVDWDQDGRLDLLVNSTNADWYRQIESSSGRVVLAPQGPLAKRVLSSHTTCPTVVDWNGNGVPDLLIGAEDGHFYYRAR